MTREGREGAVEYMSNLKTIMERITSLETERKGLLAEIDELKKMADNKAQALESEVGMLREEVRSLRVLLGADEPALELQEQEQELKKKPRR
jgi:predicted  nucleic acid-binding Zn-ribbon protein